MTHEAYMTMDCVLKPEIVPSLLPSSAACVPTSVTSVTRHRFLQLEGSPWLSPFLPSSPEDVSTFISLAGPCFAYWFLTLLRYSIPVYRMAGLKYWARLPSYE